MKEYKVTQNPKTNSCYLINKNTGSEGGIFFTHLDGIDVVQKMLNGKNITARHALELYAQITELDIPTCVVKDNKFIIEDRLNGNLLLISKKTLFENLLLHESCKETGPRFVLFDAVDIYPAYGVVFMEHMRTNDFMSKDEGLYYVDRLYEIKNINLLEKESLQNEIIESSLVDIDPDILKNWN